MPSQPPTASKSGRRLLGEIAVEKGLLTKSQLDEALSNQQAMAQLGLSERIGAILYKKKILSKAALDELLKEQKEEQKEGAGGKKRRIGNFEIYEKVGQGAMGVVFRARQITMDRIVAVKILSPKYANDPEFIERFVKEARAAGQFSHENIVGALDVGYAEPYHYFVMEYVEGQNLRKILKERGALPEKEALKYTLHIAKGLEHSLAKGIIHRDVKPENVMVTPQGLAKLLDMGLACAAGAEAEAAQGNGKEKKAAGTPHYMSPEAARGEDIDTRADLYSLGCSLFNLLTGETPYQGTTSRAIMAQHIAGPFPEARAKNPAVGGQTQRVLARMTALDRDERYESPAQLAEDLERLLAGRPPLHAAKAARSGPYSATTTGPRAPVGARGTTGPRQPVKPRGVTTGPAAPIVGDRTGSLSPTQPAGKTTRSVPARANPAALWGGIAAAAVILILIVALSGRKQQTARASLPEPEPEPRVAPAEPQSPPKKVEVEVKAPAKSEPSRGDSARTALKEALALRKAEPENYAALFVAFEKAAREAQDTEVAGEAQKAFDDLRAVHDTALKKVLAKTQTVVDEALAKGDYLAAAQAAGDDAVPAGLRAGDWQASLAAVRVKAGEQAEARAAALLAQAREKAKDLTEAGFMAAIESAKQAEALPAELAPSARTAAGERRRWEEALEGIRAAVAEQRAERMERGREMVRHLRKELAPMLQQNRFSAADELIEKRLRDTRYADAAEQLKEMQADIQSVLELRKAAVDVLKKSLGQKVALKKGAGSLSGVLVDHGKIDGIGLKVDNGPEFTMTAEQLDAADVDRIAPKTGDAEDLRRRALLFLAAGQWKTGKDLLVQARDAGLGDKVGEYLKEIELLELGESEVAARKAWEHAEQLFAGQKWKEAQTAFLAFQNDHAGTPMHEAKKADLLARLEATSTALNPHQPGLVGLIYRGLEFKEGNLITRRVDPKLEFDWGGGAPGPDLPNDNFCIRWVGFIKIEKEGEYTFATAADDGQRLWVADRKLIDDWSAHPIQKRTAEPIRLTPGVYPVRIEFYEAGGGAGIFFYWALKDGWKEQIVPESALLHDPRVATTQP